MSEEQTSPIRSLLVPVAGEDLLLPGAVVAEVAAYGELQPGPEGLLGWADWRGQQVPLVAVEGLGSEGQQDPGARARLVVLKAPDHPGGYPYFAIVADDIPRLLTVQQATLEPLEDSELPEGMLACVLANGEPAYLPDIEALQQRLRAALG